MKFLYGHLPEGGSVETEVLFKEIDPHFGAVLAENKTQDLALIKVNGLPSSVKLVELGNNSDIEIGDSLCNWSPKWITLEFY